MEYDVMIHNADLLIDAFDADHDVIYATGLTLNAFDGRHNVIRLNGISIAEAEGLTAILLGYDVSVCLLPYEED